MLKVHYVLLSLHLWENKNLTWVSLCFGTQFKMSSNLLCPSPSHTRLNFTFTLSLTFCRLLTKPKCALSISKRDWYTGLQMEEESWSKIPFQHYLNGTISQNPKRENHPVEEGSSTGKLVFFGNSDKTRSLAN